MAKRPPNLRLHGAAVDLIKLKNGSVEINVYATPRHALAAGLTKDYVRRLFSGVAEQVDEPCIRLIGPPKDDPMGRPVVSCVKKTCTKSCVLYSMPKKGDPDKDWKKEKNPTFDKNKFYKCECE